MTSNHVFYAICVGLKTHNLDFFFFNLNFFTLFNSVSVPTMWLHFPSSRHQRLLLVYLFGIWKSSPAIKDALCHSPFFCFSLVYFYQNIHAALGSRGHFSARTKASFKRKLCNDFAIYKKNKNKKNNKYQEWEQNLRAKIFISKVEEGFSMAEKKSEKSQEVTREQLHKVIVQPPSMVLLLRMSSLT